MSSSPESLGYGDSPTESLGYGDSFDAPVSTHDERINVHETAWKATCPSVSPPESPVYEGPDLTQYKSVESIDTLQEEVFAYGAAVDSYCQSYMEACRP